MERQPFPRPGERLAGDREKRPPRPKPSATERALPFGKDLDPRIARRIGSAVCVLSGCAFLVAATIVVFDRVGPRALPGVAWLLLPGIPILIVGQLWAVGILIRMKQARGPRSWNPFGRSRLKTRDFFGGLPVPAVAAVLAMFFLLGTFTFSNPPDKGGPIPPTRHCAYPLENHGDVTCVDEATYYRAGRVAQGFAATALTAFFLFHVSISAGELMRRRRQEA